MRLQGPQITHCPLGAADRAGQGTDRPQAAGAPISTPTPAGAGTLPASAGWLGDRDVTKAPGDDGALPSLCQFTSLTIPSN